MDAEVAALIASTSSASGGDKRSIDFYGFADFSYAMADSDSVFFPYETFAIGHVNAYVGSELGDDWRWLGEVRFMYLPNGATPARETFSPNATRLDTMVSDYTDFERPVTWGGINIERAWIERTFHPLLTLRFGSFLTPYGIWNVDHGSPVVIPVTRPYPIGSEFFPQRQTGIEMYGAWTTGNTQLGYHLTLSNGRGPVDTYRDFDHNRALGGRLYLRQETPAGTLTVGGSAYRGNYTDRARTIVVGEEHLSFVYSITSQYRELSLGADLKWEWEGLLLQGEVLLNDVAYTSGHRPPDPVPIAGPPGFVVDYRRVGYYALLGYRTPLWGIMPYVFAESTYEGTTATRAAAVRAGLNIRYTSQVVIKAEVFHAWYPEAPDVIFKPGNLLILQLAWSF
jgi:hypothetical protein